MATMAHKEIVKLLSREGLGASEIKTSIEPLKGEEVVLRCQLHSEPSRFLETVDGSIEVGMLSINATMMCGIEGDNLLLSFFYSAKFRYNKEEINKVGFSNLFLNSLEDEEYGLLNFDEHLRFSPGSPEDKLIANYTDFMKSSLETKVEGYLVENAGLQPYRDERKKAKPDYFKLRSDTDFDLYFEGFLVAEVRDEDRGQLSLYKTNDELPGLICQKVLSDGVVQTHVCHSTDEVIEFFGFTNLAKKLYKSAGYRYSRKVSEDGLYYEDKMKNEEGWLKYTVC